jgi:MYXO-CTERM domain-containing protein
MKRFFRSAIVATVLATSSVSALAANLSFSGNLTLENDVELFVFSLAFPSNVTLRTWSYAGGTNAAGDVIGAGGFDPVVALFAGTGNSAVLIGGNDDGLGVPADPVNGVAFDSLLDLSPLLAGQYTVAMSQVANFANGPTLGDGFLGFGNLGFDGRTSAWALDILGVDGPASIPEPTAFSLALLGLAAAGVARRRPRSSMHPIAAVPRRGLWSPFASNGSAFRRSLVWWLSRQSLKE